MELFTYLMAKNDHNTSVKEDLFSYLLGKNQSGTYTEFTGTTISANNTKKGKMKVNLLGNISQYTTTGKNLVGTTDVSSTTYNDVTYSITGDTITINGTASANSTLMTTTNFKLGENTTYNLSFISVSGTKDNTYMGLRFRKNGSQVAFIQTNDTTSKTMDLTDIDDVQLYILSGTQFNNFSFKFQLEKGSSKTSYEPYTAGASPNPSYPQDVHIVSGDNTIVSTGKNLLPSYDGITDTINGITFTKNSDGTITANGTATAGINYYVNGYTYATYTPNTYTLNITRNDFAYTGL